jgi:hypothetical protein
MPDLKYLSLTIILNLRKYELGKCATSKKLVFMVSGPEHFKFKNYDVFIVVWDP